MFAAQRGQLQPGTQVSASGFQVTLYTPQAWIAQQASEATHQGRTFSTADVTPDMLSPIVRVLAEPSTPPSIGPNYGFGVSSVGEVLLEDSAHRERVQPLRRRPFASQSQSGLLAEFSIDDVSRIRRRDRIHHARRENADT